MRCRQSRLPAKTDRQKEALERDLSKVKKIGFFGGSFDPIHNGHLNLAVEMMERHKLDQILFCPASQSPHKQAMPPIASKEHRRAMVAAAIAPMPKFTFLDIEIQKSDPSYTIDSIRTLIERDGDAARQYHLILGEDAIAHFHQWKEAEELVVLAPPFVGSREEEAFPKAMPKNIASLLKKGMTKTSIMEISSTAIRERIARGLYCGHLLPAKVWDYIVQNQLYREET